MEMDDPFRHWAEGSPAPMWCHLSTSSSPVSTPSSPPAPTTDAPCLLASTSIDLNEAPWTPSVQSPRYCSEIAYSPQCNKWAYVDQTIANYIQEETSSRVTVHSAPSTAVVFSPCPPPTAHRALASNLQDNPVAADLISLNRTNSTAASLLVPALRRPRKMDWARLDSEDLLFDEHQPFPNDFPLPERLIEHLADENEMDSIDFRELENYLYPSSSATATAAEAAQQIIPNKQTAHNCHAAASTSTALHTTESIDSTDLLDQFVDPLAEFFPDLADNHMTPHTQSTSRQFGVYGDIPYPQQQFDFLETPQQLDRFCKRESGSCSPISVGSPEGGSPSPSTSSGGAMHPRTAIVRVRASPYVLDPLDDYREKRDKNNVASARSRQKRQEKFSTMKKECAELEMKNVELRATLSTLEKSVQEYKNIMLAFMNKT